MKTDSVLGSLSPIINSMRLLGLYFTRANCEAMIAQSRQQVRRCRGWNFSRIHSTIALIVVWLNAIRYAFIFDGQETLGALLFVKLAVISSGVLVTVFQTAYYAASHTGSLDRVGQESMAGGILCCQPYGKSRPSPVSSEFVHGRSFAEVQLPSEGGNGCLLAVFRMEHVPLCLPRVR